MRLIMYVAAKEKRYGKR